jgi:hypothetical protein
MGWRDWFRLPRTQNTLPTELSGSRQRAIPLLWDLAAKGIYPAVRSGTLLQRIAGGWSPFVPPPSLRAGV